MKITPLDIQHKVFETQLRGYNRTQVDQFLEELAETIETLIRENSSSKEKLLAKEEELLALKKNETALTNTLISTQSFVDHLKRGAERDAELIVKEAELKGEEILNQSRTELIELRRVIADLRRHRVLVLEQLRGTLNTFNRIIEVEDQGETHPDLVDETELTSGRTGLPEL